MKPGDIVEIEWDDHSFVFGTYTLKGIVQTKSAGYFVEETDQYIAIALSKQVDEFSDVQVIDKRMLSKKRKVK